MHEVTQVTAVTRFWNRVDGEALPLHGLLRRGQAVGQRAQLRQLLEGWRKIGCPANGLELLLCCQCRNDAIRSGAGRHLAGVLDHVTAQQRGGGLVEP